MKIRFQTRRKKSDMFSKVYSIAILLSLQFFLYLILSKKTKTIQCHRWATDELVFALKFQFLFYYAVWSIMIANKENLTTELIEHASLYLSYTQRSFFWVWNVYVCDSRKYDFIYVRIFFFVRSTIFTKTPPIHTTFQQFLLNKCICWISQWVWNSFLIK